MQPSPPASKAIKGTVPADSPKDWLDKNNLPLTDSILEQQLGLSYPFEILLAVLESPDAVESAKFGVRSSLYGGDLFLDWLKELSAEVDLAYQKRWADCTSYKIRLYFTLEAIYGTRTYEVQSGKGTQKKANPLHLAAFFVFSERIEYDDMIGCYFRYLKDCGKWQEVSETEARETLTRFFVQFMHKNPNIYLATDSFLKEILAHAKAIGRHQDFVIPDGQLILVKGSTLFINTQTEETYVGGLSPVYKLRNQIPLKYDKSKVAYTLFAGFLKGMMPGDPSAPSKPIASNPDIKLLQYWCGMVLLGKNDLHKILVLQGEAGSGKSTLLNVLETIIGEHNTATLVTERLEDRFELSEFFGKMLLIGKDVAQDALKNRASHMLKSLSGDSGIKAEVKYLQKRVRLGGPFHICLMSNAKLFVGLQSDADAWRRRLWVLETQKPKPPPKVDPEFSKKLLKKEGSGILNWMLRGALEVLKSKRLGQYMKLQKFQADRVELLLRGDTTIDDFVRHGVIQAKDKDITSADLYMAYCNYCNAKQIDSLEQATFNKRIGMALSLRYKTKNKNVQVSRGRVLKGYSDIACIE